MTGGTLPFPPAVLFEVTSQERRSRIKELAAGELS